jgi:hypothetical protein
MNTHIYSTTSEDNTHHVEEPGEAVRGLFVEDEPFHSCIDKQLPNDLSFASKAYPS